MEASNSIARPRTRQKLSDSSTTTTPTTEEKTLDRISVLPDSVLLDILSFLPATDAIKTCVLSKRWQFLWTFLQVLDFGDKDLCVNGPWYVSFMVSLITDTLMLHQSPKLKKLCLHIFYEEEIRSNVDVWLRFAAVKNVEELELDYINLTKDELCDVEDEIEDEIPDNYYVVPVSVMNNSCLVSLKLTLCDLRYGGLINWKSLKFLYLRKMSLCNDLIGEILCGSPMLEFFELFECKDFDFLHIKSERMRKLVVHYYGSSYDPSSDVALKIVAPNIKSLRISGSLNARNIVLTISSSLVDVQLEFNLWNGEEVSYLKYAKNVLELLQNLQHVKDLTVGFWCLEVLARLEMETLPFLPSKLECLTVCTDLSRKQQSGIVRLLSLFGGGRVPLTLLMYTAFPSCIPSEDEPLHNDVENCLSALRKKNSGALERIQTVKIVDFSVQEREIQLILFLLKNARRLEKMIIRTCPSATVDLKKSFEASQRILSTPRGSENSAVVFS